MQRISASVGLWKILILVLLSFLHTMCAPSEKHYLPDADSTVGELVLQLADRMESRRLAASQHLLKLAATESVPKMYAAQIKEASLARNTPASTNCALIMALLDNVYTEEEINESLAHKLIMKLDTTSLRTFVESREESELDYSRYAKWIDGRASERRIVLPDL